MSIHCEHLWMNGHFVPHSDVKVPITSHALHYASSVFEGLMVYDGQVFKLDDHITRLLASAKTMYLNIDFDFEQIKEAILQLVKMNACDSGSYYVRPLVFPVEENLTIKRDHSNTAKVMVCMKKLDPVGITKSASLCLSSWVKAPSNSVPHQCKGAGNYMNSILSKQQAVELGCDDSLLLDYKGCVAEGASTNVFFIDQDKNLVTPTTAHCLSGITRKTVMDIAKNLGIKVVERDIASFEINNFIGLFLTGTAVEIHPVKSLYFPKEQRFKNFEDFQLAEDLHKEYKKLCMKHKH